jgi:hypothetical protein
MGCFFSYWWVPFKRASTAICFITINFFMKFKFLSHMKPGYSISHFSGERVVLNPFLLLASAILLQETIKPKSCANQNFRAKASGYYSSRSIPKSWRVNTNQIWYTSQLDWATYNLSTFESGSLAYCTNFSHRANNNLYKKVYFRRLPYPSTRGRRLRDVFWTIGYLFLVSKFLQIISPVLFYILWSWTWFQ